MAFPFSKTRFFRHRPGFSLVEVLLAIFILSFGLMAAISLVTSSVRQNYGNRDVIVAAGLAQEGVELVRNVRDNNFAARADGASRTAFSSGFPSGDDSTCRIDRTMTSVDCNPSSYNLCLSGDFYAHGSCTPKYSRRIFLDQTGDSTNGFAFTAVSVVWWGGSIPSGVSASSQTNCTMKNKCAYALVKLSDWYDYMPLPSN